MQEQYEAQNVFSEDVTLFDRYGNIIFSYIRLHTITSEDAEDLTLEVFIAAYQRDNLSLLSNGAEHLAWLKRVARNKLVDYYRTKKRHPTVALDQFVETILDEDYAPEEHALQQEAHKELRDFVKRLPAQQQQILQLRYSEGLNCAEIAILLKKREGTVRQILSRTIKLLRTMYQH